MLNVSNLSRLNFIIKNPGGDAPAPEPDLLLNTYPGASAAYSLRKLDKTYTGSTIRVRRSSDNAEQDFTSAEITDGTLTTFTGAGNGFVTTWYDQSGNGNDATQTTKTSQPKIVNNGVVVKENGEPAIAFDNFPALLSTAGISEAVRSAFVVRKFDQLPSSLNINYWVWNQRINDDNRLGAVGLRDGKGKVFPLQLSGGSITEINGIANTESLNTLLRTDILNDSNILKGFQNGSEFLSDAGFSPTHGGGTLHLGDYDGNGSDGLIGKMSEAIFYASDQSANRTGIEDNINNHYNIY